MNGTLIAGRTSLPEMAKTLTSARSGSPQSAVTAPAYYGVPVYNKLTYAQERRLTYEIRRAKSSFEARRYNNAVYHIKQALLLDRGNIEMRDLLQRMQPAQSKPMSASAHDNPVASPDKGHETIDSPAETSRRSYSFADAARSEISEGDAYMLAGNYDMALRKFLTAAVLDPSDENNLADRIRRARDAKGATGNFDNDSTTGEVPIDPSGIH